MLFLGFCHIYPVAVGEQKPTGTKAEKVPLTQSQLHRSLQVLQWYSWWLFSAFSHRKLLLSWLAGSLLLLWQLPTVLTFPWWGSSESSCIFLWTEGFFLAMSAETQRLCKGRLPEDTQPQSSVCCVRSWEKVFWRITDLKIVAWCVNLF